MTTQDKLTAQETNEFEAMLRMFTQALGGRTKPPYNYDINKHVGKTQEEVVAAITASVEPQSVPSQDLNSGLLKQHAIELTNVAYPQVKPTIQRYKGVLGKVITQATNKGVPMETLVQVFEDRVNAISMQEKDYILPLVEEYMNTTEPIVKRFVDEMAPHLDALIAHTTKFEPQFINVIAELLVFAANYSPSNEAST